MRLASVRVGVCPEDRQRPAHTPESVALAIGAVLCVNVVHGFTVKANGSLPDTRTPMNWY